MSKIMIMTSNLRRSLGGSAVLAALVLAGCGGGGAVETPAADATAGVPSSAGGSTQGFVDYQKGLAADETSEPVKLQGFVPPVDDTAEPFSLG